MIDLPCSWVWKLKLINLTEMSEGSTQGGQPKKVSALIKLAALMLKHMANPPHKLDPFFNSNA